ncbi:MAG: GNAT family N-acyltransferase [Flavobacteriales bacterium Tduv]
MELITQKEFKEAIGLTRYGKPGDWVSRCLMRFSYLDKINAIYDRYKHISGGDFLTVLLEDFQLRYEIHQEDLKRIPKEGPFITVSNHPLGALDGILLMKILSDIRLDYKVMANFLLNRIEPLQPYIFPVNPFEYQSKYSLLGLKEAVLYLKKGHPIGMFPAGEVSSIQKDTGEISDRAWQEPAIKFIIKAKVPVIPIYFHGHNSRLFYQLGKWNERLRTAMLPAEMFRQRGKLIRMRIGNPVLNKQLENMTVPVLTDFLRRKTYILANVYHEKNIIDTYKKKLKFWNFNKKPKEILPPVSSELIQRDLNQLYPNDLLFSNTQYEMFFASAEKIPNILTEIGRLREVAFREVGQGTNKSVDLDKYDQYYYHLFLWDRVQKRLVGAYRMGFGREIFDKYGINGFYLTKFFIFNPEMYPLFRDTIEMGRAFLVKEYQQKALPLFLLWRGILHLTLRHPEYQYLIGAVGISSQFSDFSISVIVEFMKSHFYDPFVAQYVRPKNAYKVRVKYADKAFIFNESKADLNKFDKLIDEIEPGNLRFPVLIKKYVKQNARVIAFNVDSKFNDSIDGLMYIRIADLPEDIVKPVIEEFQAEIEKKNSLQQKTDKSGQE